MKPRIPGNRGSDEATVRSLDDQERTAALNRDVPTLERLWSDRLTVNAPNNELLIGKPAVLDWVHRGVINFSSFERTIECIRVDGDLALADDRTSRQRDPATLTVPPSVLVPSCTRRTGCTLEVPKWQGATMERDSR